MKEVKKEALRYLGYRSSAPDNATEELLNKAYDELNGAVCPHYCYKFVEKSDTAGLLKGEDIARHLKDSERVIIFAATLGSGADKLIRTAEIRNMAYALVLDALASAMVEEFCDSAEKEMHEKTGGYFTWRYSPGYGDYPLDVQADVISFLNAGKLIGLTVTDSNILIPRKSVTAVIGVSEKEQSKGLRGCAACSLRERCSFRKDGATCRS